MSRLRNSVNGGRRKHRREASGALARNRVDLEGNETSWSCLPFPHLHRRATTLYQLWSQTAQASGTELPQKPAEVGIMVNGASWEETGPALIWEERWSRTEKKNRL